MNKTAVRGRTSSTVVPSRRVPLQSTSGGLRGPIASGRSILIVAVAMLFIGCGAKAQPVTLPPVTITKVEVVRELVPTPMPIEPPAALLQPLPPPTFTFIAPSDPKATSALDPDGERGLLAWVALLKAERDALIAYLRSLMKKE